MNESKRLVFDVTYEWHRLDSHGNLIGPNDVSLVLCDTIDEALKEHRIWLDSTINEVKAHRWDARRHEAGSCSIHAVYVNEENDYINDAWNELSDKEKRLINDSCVTFMGRDL